jgi:hypothetical protein
VKLLPACLAVLLSLGAPAADAQSDALAQIALGAADVDGWTAGPALRDETWDVADQNAPDTPSLLSWYESRFTRDDGQEVLTSRVSTARGEVADAYLATLRHNALGQTPIQVGGLGHDALAWRERDTASALARIGDVTIELHVSGVSDADPVGDDQIVGWLAQMIDRSNAVPELAAVDWSQLMGDEPAPWNFVMDAGMVGSDWLPRSGLELRSSSDGGSIDSVSASRAFARSGPFRRTLTSTATVYRSPDAASARMSSPGAQIDAPQLGEAAAAFRASEAGGEDAPSVTYSVDVRRGSVVMSTRETGVAWSLDSPDELFALATTLDARSAQLISP